MIEQMNNSGWIFPGQGSQSPGMGRKFLARKTFADVVNRIEDATGRPITVYITETDDTSLRRTDRAQLAIFSMSMGIAACLAEEGIAPNFVAGHSLGHISALTAVGAMNLENAAELVKLRGSLMNASGNRIAGGMGVVQGVPAAQIVRELDKAGLRVWLGNLNLSEQAVVSGAAEDLPAARDLLVGLGGKWIPLNVSGAFHSPLLAKEAVAFGKAVARARFSEPSAPVVSNINGKLLRSAEDIRRDLMGHMTAQVRWTSVMDRMISLSPNSLTEVGPGKVLTGLMLRHHSALRPSSTGQPALLDRAISSHQPQIFEKVAA